MRFKRRMKRSTKQYIVVALICIIVIGGAAAFTSVVITNQIEEEYQALLNAAYRDMADNQKSVYIAVGDISSGDLIKKEMLVKKNVYSSQPMDTFITAKDIGKTALVNISTGTQILKGMVTENNVTAKLRETEYQVISMNSNIRKHDIVDIRIFFPNGESYVVLSKKEIKEYTPEIASVYLWLEEEDLLRMSAAIVDAGLYIGSKLYVTKYIEPNLQEASVITYTPSLSILSLIENDPNIIERCSQELNKEVRKALENRLAKSMSADVSSANWNVDKDYSYVPASSEAMDNSLATDSKDTSENESETRRESESESEDKSASVIISPTTTPYSDSNTESRNEESELGSESYFYYAEDSSLNGDIEYGD